jgi:hypothetical protein
MFSKGSKRKPRAVCNHQSICADKQLFFLFTTQLFLSQTVALLATRTLPSCSARAASAGRVRCATWHYNL